ncbi:hypothetical protein [Spiroplasma endosymbiont of Labia minor]|uniref:hypothetical protein n=1 Tax=Spiroplasma endosymbiont of Labia minor TaxID=3066305 RepID=UPI0030CCB8B8
MTPFTNLNYNQKITIELYFIREILRNLDVTNDDNDRIKNFYCQALLSLNLVQIDGSDNEEQLNNSWTNLVDSYKEDNIMDLLDYLVEPTVLNNDGESKLNIDVKHKNYFEIYLKLNESLFKWQLKAIEPILKTIKAFLRLTASATKIVEALSVAFIWVDLAIELLDSIDIRTTKIYRFEVSKNQFLTYQQTNWAWEPSDFDPSRTFDVLEIAKPVNEITYLYNDKYFSNLNEAYRYEKRDIINDLFSYEKNIKYTSKYFDGLTYDSKEELIVQVYKTVEVKRAYADEFGDIFDSYEQALNSILRHIENIDYNKIYFYDFNGIQILRETYQQVYDEVLLDINIESKLIDFDELFSTTIFDQLTDLNNEGYQIYTFVYVGKNYYFNSQSAAIIYYLKLHNFTNELVKIDYSTYTLNNQTFDSRESYIDYLYANLKEITGENL